MDLQNYDIVFLDDDEDQEQNNELSTNRTGNYVSYEHDEDMEIDDESDIIVYCPEGINDSESDNETDIVLEVDTAALKKHLATVGQQKSTPPSNSVKASVIRPTALQPPAIPVPIQHITNRKQVEGNTFIQIKYSTEI